jgi:hypothetical protein
MMKSIRVIATSDCINGFCTAKPRRSYRLQQSSPSDLVIWQVISAASEQVQVAASEIVAYSGKKSGLFTEPELAAASKNLRD